MFSEGINEVKKENLHFKINCQDVGRLGIMTTGFKARLQNWNLISATQM